MIDTYLIDGSPEERSGSGEIYLGVCQKILIVADDLLAQGGTQTFAQELGNVLSRQENFVSYLSVIGESDKASDGIEFLGCRRNVEILLRSRVIRDRVASNDLVLVLSGQIFQYFCLLTNSNKVVYRESNNPHYRHAQKPLWGRLLLDLLYQNFLRQRPRLIVQNPLIYSSLERVSPPGHRIKFVPNPCFIDGSDVEDIHRSYDLIFISRHTFTKGIDRAEYILTNSKLTSVVLGENTAFNEVSRYSNIDCVGRVDNVTEYYLRAKYLLLPSRMEGFPNCVQEAIQCGTRVLASAELSWLPATSEDFRSAITIVDFSQEDSARRAIEAAVAEYDEPIPHEVRARIRAAHSVQRYLEEIID